MTFRIPSEDRRVSQTNESDVTGNIYATRNIDFDEKGYIKLSDGVVSLYSEDNDSDFNGINTIFHGSDVYLFGSDLFKETKFDLSGGLTNVTATDTTPPSPGAEDDGVFFNGTEVVSDGGTIKYNNSGTWVTISGTTSPGTGVPVCMEVFNTQNSLLIGVGNVLQRYNTSWALAQTLTLPADYRIMSIAINGNYAYIGTRHTGNGEAMLYLWNGSNTTNDGAYGVGTFEIPSVKPYGSSVALVTSLGQLLRFNGSGFDELGSFPIYYTEGTWTDASNDYGGVTNRGMVVDGEKIYLNVDPALETATTTRLINMPGGIWCYDPKVGLYHKWSATNTIVVKDTDVDTADIDTTTNIITVSGIVVPPTGSPVHYDGATKIGGLTDVTWYYTIKVSDTTFKLAATYADALAGTAIDLTSGTDNNIFYFISQKDYGVTDPLDRNSIIVLNNDEYNSKQIGRIIFASDADNAAGTERTRINATCPWVFNRGYFITPKMYANDVEDTFNSITLRFRPLKTEDSIIVKYRDTERLGMPTLTNSSSGADSTGTWTSTTVFTTTSAPSFMPLDLSMVQVGDEVEVLSGAGAGHIAHVVSCVKSGFQYTVTLDEAIPLVAANDLMTFVINNWKRLDTIDSTWGQSWKTVSVDTASSWCQFKIELRGRKVAIEDSVVNNHPHARNTGFSGAR